jgi:hypothetical protein
MKRRLETPQEPGWARRVLMASPKAAFALCGEGHGSCYYWLC